MRPSYLKKDNKPICPICGIPMELDDVDYRFEGNQDEYWVCPNAPSDKCESGAFVKVRYGKVCKITID